MLLPDLLRESLDTATLECWERERTATSVRAFVGGLFFDTSLQQALWPALIGLAVVLVAGLLVLERTISSAENGLISRATVHAE